MSKRNATCSCGSGVKFKRCCGKPKPVEPPVWVVREKTPEELEREKALLSTMRLLNFLATRHV